MDTTPCMSEQDACPLPQHCDVQPQYVYESTVHPQNLLSTLNEQRKFGLLCDITVIVEGVQLLAHKAVLAACSSYFNGIITDPANVSHNIVLELSSITKVGMENLLEFAYTSKLTVSKDNIDHVLCAARELEVKNLEYSCLNLLKQKLLQHTTGAYSAPQCVEGKNLCRNSTISRHLVPSKSEPSAHEKPSTKCLTDASTSPSLLSKNSPLNQPLLAGGGCPLMSQLSLNPKPLLSVQHLSGCVVDKTPLRTENLGQTPTVVKQLGNFGSLEKNEKQSILPRILPQPQTVCSQRPAPVVKMVTVSPSTSEIKEKVTCSFYPPAFPLSCPDTQNKNRYVFSSSCNSDTDETLSADDDGERSYKCPLSAVDSIMCKTRKYPDVVLPLSVEEITKLPRSELQDLLNKHPNLSVQQINAMHEIRRRGKNRIAAQRCRKRKMDCIRAIQCKLETLHKEHNELMNERRSVCENAGKLSDLFQRRCMQVFSDSAQSCKKAMCDDNGMKGIDEKEDVIASMAKYFHDEAKEAKNLVERLNKFPCSNLPPFNWSCPVANPEIVVVCDEEEQCCKPCSPSLWSTASISSDVTDGSNVECSSMQDVQCPGLASPPQSSACKRDSSGGSTAAPSTCDLEPATDGEKEATTCAFIVKTSVS